MGKTGGAACPQNTLLIIFTITFKQLKMKYPYVQIPGNEQANTTFKQIVSTN